MRGRSPVRHTPPPPFRSEKNAGPDNETNIEKRKLPCLQLSSKRSLLIARLAEFIDRLCSEDIQHFLPKMFDMVLHEAPYLPLMALECRLIGGRHPRVSVFGRALEPAVPEPLDRLQYWSAASRLRRV